MWTTMPLGATIAAFLFFLGTISHLFLSIPSEKLGRKRLSTKYFDLCAICSSAILPKKEQFEQFLNFLPAFASIIISTTLQTSPDR